MIKATDKNIKDKVKQEIEKLGTNADLNHIDVSAVTDMSFIFYENEFHGDVSKWDVSNVTDMNYMFATSEFNGDISNWNVSNVKNMNSMFYESGFNQDISNWDVSNVRDMSSMFVGSSFSGIFNKELYINGEEATKEQILKYKLKVLKGGQYANNR